MNIEKQRVVVLGGSSGIGYATAQAAAREGAEVVIASRSPERAAAELGVDGFAVDLNGGAGALFAELGEFDHLVLAFSSGSIGLAPLKSITPADLRTAFEGKLFGYLTAIRHAQVTGSVTMVSAASARAALPTTSLLAAVNGAIERMVSPLAAELAPVRVNAVSPGVIDTPWWSFLPEEQRDEQFAAFGGQLPVGRIGRAEEVADAIVYLIGAGFVTSCVLPVDGGATIA